MEAQGAQKTCPKENFLSQFKGKAITVSAESHLDFAAEQIWPQLCPVREYDWIEVWQCQLLRSQSGYNELGCIFQTDFATEGGPEVWMTTCFDPYKRIEFVRANGVRVIHFVIELIPEGQGTKIIWTHNVTALNEAGNAYVEGKPEAFATQMSMLEKMLGHYLATGKMLRGQELGLMEKIKNHVHSWKTG